MREVVKLLAVVLVLLGCVVGSARAAGLAELVDQIPLSQVFPGAERLGPPEGTPAVAPAYQGDRMLGWVFLNSDWVDAAGYSGKPIQVAVGMDTDGRIVGAKLMKHAEPIVLVGIPQKKIEDFIAGYVGRSVLDVVNPATAKGPDLVSGATVTVMVIGDTMMRSGVLVARAKGIGGPAPSPEAERRQVDTERAGSESWDELVSDGSVRRLHLSVGDVNRAFAERGDPRAAERPEAGDDNDDFLDLYVAEVSAPVIGRSLLGDGEYQALTQRLGGRPAILVMGQGRYSFRGSGYVRGGIFDRFELIQDTSTIRFRDRNYERLGDVAATGAPSFPEIGLFAVPEGAELDPTRPFALQLLVQRPVGALDKTFITFDLPYHLPEKWLMPAVAPPPPQVSQPLAEPLWQRIWQAKAVEIGVLVTALAVLTAIFFFQDVLVKRPRLTGAIRWTFLAFTLVWLGWYADAQLSVVNILALSSALVTGFSWDYFLMDPLLFILWSAVAVALLFWGRGAFCGWLCPFGALQEFVSLAAKRLKVPQITLPWGLHERLWPIKYIIFLGLFGFALYSLTTAEHLAEIEPFKTAIILKFIRHWPFVLFAVLLLVAGLFIERFFCRYLCPLGAALAIPARLRMFEWLKRHAECGKPCQRCANECPVQCIHPDGRINPNECIYCLHCQTLYWDEHRCPAMIQRRLKRERRAAMSAPPPVGSQSAATPHGGN